MFFDIDEMRKECMCRREGHDHPDGDCPHGR
jgi:hypothetical protein